MIISSLISISAPQVEFLLSHGAVGTISDSYGKCAIHVASERGLLRCLSVLVEGGVSLEVVDGQGQTPLSSAVTGLFVSLCVYVCLSVCLCVYMSVSYVCLCVYVSLCLSILMEGVVAVHPSPDLKYQ